jgi:hypothetical protein
MSNQIKNTSESLIKIIPNLKSVINIDNEKISIPFITQKSVI